MNIRIDLNLDFKNVEGVVNLLSKYMNLDTNTNNKTNILTKNVAKNIVTDEMIRTAIAKLASVNKGEKAKQILLSYKAAKVSQINETDYEKIYGDVEINFLAIDWEAKTKYGIRLTRNQRIGKEKLVKINEELEEEDIKEFLNNVFQDIGYNIENISFQLTTNKILKNIPI